MPELDTATKIDAIEKSGFHIAWDTCHKIYLLEDEATRKHAQEDGYTILPASSIRETITDSCSLVFIERWGRLDGNYNHPWAISQFKEGVREAAEQGE